MSPRKWLLIVVASTASAALLYLMQISVIRSGADVSAEIAKTSAGSTHSTSSSPEQANSDAASGMIQQIHQLGYSSPTVPTYTSWDFTRAIEFLDTRSFKVHTAERQADGDFEHFEWSYSTSFDIQSIGSRESQFLYLSGQDRAGGIIFEEWELGVRLGELSAQRSSSTPVQPIGTSTPYSSTETFVQGGSLGDVENRRITAPVQRDQVVVTHEFPFVRLMDVDPEGRFLMVLGGNLNLYQIGLLGADRGSVTPILDSSVAWPFADPVWFANCWISRVQHATQGRLWILGELPRVGASDEPLPTTCVILADADNDGVFEQHHVMTWDQAVASGFVDEDYYIDTFDGSFE